MTAIFKSAKRRAIAAAGACAAIAAVCAPACAQAEQRIISTNLDVIDIAQGGSMRRAPCPGCRLTLTLDAPRRVGGVICYQAGRAEIRGPDGAIRFGAHIDQTHMIEMGGSALAMISLTRDGSSAPSVMEVEVFAGAARVRLDDQTATGARQVASLGR